MAPNKRGRALAGTWLSISGDWPWNSGISPRSTWKSMASNQVIQRVISRGAWRVPLSMALWDIYRRNPAIYLTVDEVP